ncbi:BTB/POZ domain-containing protein, putative [Eimeria maxima]|uniref:BTB/POZ domain-containing protein, putative n=1 Tax=Eimeria maxima TaxID=5804 RepID=U6LXC9_EIMMA|nr:BTB/POZ domain-containing protein, putative [Eimeria maxima]CDJ56597.1 BTB/POZ domain-containing protein, putative [Eimeria maxima]
MDCKNVLMSEGVVEPLFQLLVHKVTIAKFDLLRDLAKKKALPDCPEDSEEFFEHGTVLFLGSFGQAAGLELQAKRGYVRFFFNWTDHNILRVSHIILVTFSGVFQYCSGSFKEANSSFIALEDMDTDVAIMLIEWIQEDKYGGIAFHVGRKTHTKVLSRLPDSAELNWTRCMRVLMAADKFQVHTLVHYCICHLRRLLTQGSVTFDEIIVVRKMLQQCTGTNTTKLGQLTFVVFRSLQIIFSAARDCEAYVTARAASDPSKMWSILDCGSIEIRKPCGKATSATTKST